MPNYQKQIEHLQQLSQDWSKVTSTDFTDAAFTIQMLTAEATQLEVRMKMMEDLYQQQNKLIDDIRQQMAESAQLLQLLSPEAQLEDFLDPPVGDVPEVPDVKL